MSNLLGPRDANGIPVPMTVDESIASMKASLLKKIKRSAYVYRVDCGGCNGCEIEIFATLSPLFDAERFGIKVVPSPRHADILLFTGAVTRAMRSPALRAWQSAPDPKICISYGACGRLVTRSAHDHKHGLAACFIISLSPSRPNGRYSTYFGTSASARWPRSSLLLCFRFSLAPVLSAGSAASNAASIFTKTLPPTPARPAPPPWAACSCCLRSLSACCCGLI